MGEFAFPLGWIPALPLIGAAILGLMRGLFRRDISHAWTAFVSLVAVLASLFFLLAAFFELLTSVPGGAIVARAGTWLGAGIAPNATMIDFAFRLDPLASVVGLLVAGGGLFAVVYAIATLPEDHREDRGPERFLGFTCLALAAMLLLVLADDLLLFWAAWCVLGLSTWWLLGFWYADEAQTHAVSVAFVVGRLGDAALLAAWILILRAAPETDGSFSGLAELKSVPVGLQAVMLHGFGFLGVKSWTGSEAVASLLLVALVSRAALLPFSRWMVNGSKAPVAALILVQTLFSVGAPIYLGSRMNLFFLDAPSVASCAGWLGALSALFGSLIACRQTDVFRLLSWSTVSQVGLAVVGIAALDEAAAVFQLMAHALHKSLLFMTMGVAVAAVGGSTDIRRMGNLGSRLWRTRIDTWAAALSICGLVPMTMGFFSVEQILFAVAPSQHLAGPGGLVWVVILAIGFTSFSIMRLIYLTLYGETRIPETIRWAGIEDPGPALLWLMALLAVGIFAGTLIAMPQIWADLLFVEIRDANSLRHFLGLSPLALSPERQWTLVAWATSSAWLGGAVGVGLYLYRPDWLRDALTRGDQAWFSRSGRTLRRDWGAGRISNVRVMEVGEKESARSRDRGFESWILSYGEKAFWQLIAWGIQPLQSGRASQYFSTALLACWAILLGLLWFNRS